MRRVFPIFWLFSVLSFFSIEGKGQSDFKLVINQNDPLVASRQSIHSDSAGLQRECVNVLNECFSKGFVSAYFDTIQNKKHFVELFLNKGVCYEWKKLTVSPLILSIIKDEIRVSSFFNSNEIENLIQEVLTVCGNNGYPFAQVYFDSVQFHSKLISANLQLNLHRFITIDSIEIKGGVRTSRNYIQKQIGIEKGHKYDESKMSKISQKIRNISFVKEIRAAEVYFIQDKARLVLYLTDKKASRFDGIVGINNEEITGKIQLVGDLKVNLLNAFKRGENILLNWERAKTLSQKYVLNFDYPFLFDSKVGLSSGVNYYRQDTSFANLNAKFGLYLFVNYRQKIGVLTRFVESNSLTSFDLPASGIPNVNSVSTIYYGIDYLFNSLDYKLNPRKGFLINTELITGEKRVKKNSIYASEEYGEIVEKSTQIKSEVSISSFFPLFRRNTLLLRLNSGAIFTENIFENELFQLGGLKSLRGFNEQSIFASKYIIGTAEYRFLFDKNSALFGFFDLGVYENKSVNTSLEDTPFGFGLGVNFQVKAGIFTLSYGLGRQKNNPILVKNGKVHFGFVSLF